MNAREEIHGLSRANVDMLERSAARAFLGCGISLLAGAVWLLTGPVAKADVVTNWNVTAGDKSLPCIYIARLSPFMDPDRTSKAPIKVESSPLSDP
jgi:hypothetical protein